ncbi:MAG: hypothetical protein RLZZ324_282 [Candidatus Parcubacteria bacterium]|jgi:ubiquinone/menaquinone biosynthesis C-methylase UbiE
MRRIKDSYLQTLQSIITLSGKDVIEIGCGNGARTADIAALCAHVTAIDPDAQLITQAKSGGCAPNVTFGIGSADALPVIENRFDIAFFTLSFHHVPTYRMRASIEEAVRVLRYDGAIVFFEPAFDGTFFEAEVAFDACDGDERKGKAAAYAAMLSHHALVEIAERYDETVFAFDSDEDFIASMRPKKGTREEIRAFLERNGYTLRAQRRINVFRTR